MINQETLKKVIRMECTETELEVVWKQNCAVFEGVPDCDSEWIENGFRKYKNGEITEHYFRMWAEVYAWWIHQFFVEDFWEISPTYEQIARILRGIGKGTSNYPLEEALEIIKKSYQVCSQGQVKTLPSGFCLVDEDVFMRYLEEGEEYQVIRYNHSCLTDVQLLYINHYRKIYRVSFDIRENLIDDEMDEKDRVIRKPHEVDRAVFDIILEGIIAKGYQQEE